MKSIIDMCKQIQKLVYFSHANVWTLKMHVFTKMTS